MPNTLAAALRQAQTSGLPRLEAQMLLLHSVGQDPQQRAWLIAHDDKPLSAEAQSRFATACQRRLSGEPVAYIVGEKAFYGLRLRISPAVLDPRDDSETLVDWALALLQDKSSARVLDLGTGSGAIALAIAAHAPQAQVQAVDASAEALAVAQNNGRQLKLPVQWRLGHWFAPVAGQRFDVIVSNPPYIAEDDPHLPALAHEPRMALTAGADGLDDIRHIIAAAPAQLKAGGWLLLEHGHEQGPAVAALLQKQGFEAVQHRHDLAGIARCTGGQWPTA